MGRVLLLPPGSAYNIGYCLLVALGGTSFAGAVFLVARKARTRGGRGGLLCHRRYGNDDHRPSDRQGCDALDQHALHRERPDGQAPAGALAEGLQRAIPDPGPRGQRSRDGAPWRDLFLCRLPWATTMPRFGLLSPWALRHGHAALDKEPQGPLRGDCGCTLTWTLLANTWVLPLQGLAILLWLAVNWRDWSGWCRPSRAARQSSGLQPGFTFRPSRPRRQVTTRLSAWCPGTSTRPRFSSCSSCSRRSP